MHQIDKNTIKNLIQLCRIKCTEEEQEKLQQDLKKILDYADLLNEIDTANVPPCNQVLADMTNIMREDVIGETLPRELFLKNAPDQIDGLIRVPPVIKSN